MSADSELEGITASIQTLESQFVDSSALGLHLRSEHEAEFKRLAIEAKALLDLELGSLNDFSRNLFLTINQNSGGYLGGPSLAAVQSARAVIEAGINTIRRKATQPVPKPGSSEPTYVSLARLAELRALSTSAWDVTRLIRLLEELNTANANRCHMSTAMLVRAVTDHVPPIFGCKTFLEVANNYSGAKSFRGSMQHLQGSLRNIADAHLHVQIRQSETLPTEAQVNFRTDLDVLLGEVVRLLQ